MPGQLLTELSVSDVNDQDVELILDPIRKVTSASGLLGIRAREVIVNRTGRGSRNLTRFRDDAQVVIAGLLTGGSVDDTWAQYDVVAGVLADAIDTDRWLKWTAGNNLKLQKKVRLASIESPIELGPDMIKYQATLRGSDPNVYSQELYSASSRPLGSGVGGGLTFPLIFPFLFAAPVNTVVSYKNSGFVPTPPIIELHGYLSNPTVLHSSGAKFVINGTIAEGDVLTIDVDSRTVFLNGIENRRYMLVTNQSTWFELPKGSGEITLISSVFSPAAYLSVTWRDARN